jgi:hypothetical protein
MNWQTTEEDAATTSTRAERMDVSNEARAQTVEKLVICTLPRSDQPLAIR